MDSIYYLCFAKSYFSNIDTWNIQQGKTGFRIDGHFNQLDATYQVSCVLRENGKKEIEVNNESYGKMSQHLGRFPCIMIVPDDIALINDHSDIRRKFLDNLLSQLDNNYLHQLIAYNKYLQQRNVLLKKSGDNAPINTELLTIYNHQLAHHGQPIYERRKLFLDQFIPLVIKTYNDITDFREEQSIALTYESDLHIHPILTLLEQRFSKDLLLQRTTAGIHRDDILLSFNEQPFKTVASQGQKKSLLFALKLAAFEMLKTIKGFPPILLLDDVFEKLDGQRIQNLLRCVFLSNAQLFITDTHVERLQKISDTLQKPLQLVPLS